MVFSLNPAEPGRMGAHDNLLQTGFWGRFKSAFGWQVSGFLVQKDDGPEAPLLILRRSLGGTQYLAYVPHGPSAKTVSEGDWAGLKALAVRLKKELPRGLVFLRFDLPWPIKETALNDKRQPGFYRASMDIQPPSTVILDLSLSEEELLGGMKKKNRYNIRLSEKKGVVVRQAGPEELPLWYHLYEETAVRDKIALHKYGYYKTLFDMAAEKEDCSPELKLFLAEIDGEVEAGIIMSIQGERATYLYGASSNRKRNYMPSYGLQWAALRYAREAGCQEYDMYGIPPDDSPEHPMAGLYRFKTGFGGKIVHRPGAWDFPASPLMYRAYRLAEALRGWYYRKAKKRGR